MKQENREAAAAAIVEGERVAANLAELVGRLGSCFARVEPFRQAGKYIVALASDLPRKNGGRSPNTLVTRRRIGRSGC